MTHGLSNRYHTARYYTDSMKCTGSVFFAIILLLSTKLFVFTAGMKYVQSQQ